MSTVRQVLVVAIALSTVAFTSTAMAGKGGVKGGNNLTAPGQAGTSPGQVFKSDPTALSPGQQYKQDRESLIPSLPPGQTFGTPGQKIPGSLP